MADCKSAGRRSERVGSPLGHAFEKLAVAQLASMGAVLKSRLKTVQMAGCVGVRECTRVQWACRARFRWLVSEEPHAAC
jgi:hypothetical protein